MLGISVCSGQTRAHIPVEQLVTRTHTCIAARHAYTHLYCSSSREHTPVEQLATCTCTPVLQLVTRTHAPVLQLVTRVSGRRLNLLQDVVSVQVVGYGLKLTPRIAHAPTVMQLRNQGNTLTATEHGTSNRVKLLSKLKEPTA